MVKKDEEDKDDHKPFHIAKEEFKKKSNELEGKIKEFNKEEDVLNYFSQKRKQLLNKFEVKDNKK